MIGAQLPLSVQLRDSAALDGFIAGPNGEVVGAIRAALRGQAPRRLLLHGASGSGRTHLLQAAVRTATDAGQRASYLSLNTAGVDTPQWLEGLEFYDLLALDDLDAAIRDRDWAVALARLLDTVRARDTSLLLSANQPPEYLPTALPDLRTRLSACAVFALKPLDDLGRRQFLQQRAQLRGLELADDAADYLVRRLPRDGNSLMQALDELDRASLTAQRRLTLPFVQRWLAVLGPTNAQKATR